MHMFHYLRCTCPLHMNALPFDGSQNLIDFNNIIQNHSNRRWRPVTVAHIRRYCCCCFFFSLLVVVELLRHFQALCLSYLHMVLSFEFITLYFSVFLLLSVLLSPFHSFSLFALLTPLFIHSLTYSLTYSFTYLLCPVNLLIDNNQNDTFVDSNSTPITQTDHHRRYDYYTINIHTEIYSLLACLPASVASLLCLLASAACFCFCLCRFAAVNSQGCITYHITCNYCTSAFFLSFLCHTAPASHHDNPIPSIITPLITLSRNVCCCV